MKNQLFRIVLGVLLCSVAFIQCDTISHFDQTTYTQVTSVEADALLLMDKATEDYTLHISDVVRFQGNY